MKKICFAFCSAFVFDVNLAFGASEGMPQLNPEFWPAQIFWLILIFSILYVAIWKSFLPKITYTIENRKTKIISDLNETQKLKENAEKKLIEYKKIIENAKKEAKKIIEENRKKLKVDIENKKKIFNAEIEKEILKVEKEIKNLKKTSIININKIAVDISCELLRKVVKTEVNMSNVSAIVEDVSKQKLNKYL